ncbi:dienelactone hydrolase family protein [Epilithonimonas ginsengisoli]|uniref:Dienelactone hydrolase family protein n=1 Tax=Epilithonimonas ginsengisoli TaxID=1245592 RepID=A0ABU4JLU7_9FLAO|nr:MULTISPECIES: dienelactone hydrolase family protein [Chryseobacterium group]MBV6881657.1 dienelactone hydrolase family protein [Epilithonimonas sp. FP105]MDW8550665.1 dienelactone hydrolase family protein [Epilithonimonas ginsengisoli]OAH70946.1 dienelactone hydrolase [Chryseobacterium sp. FP211-J200]
MKLSLTLLTVFLGMQLTLAQTLKTIAYKDGTQKLNGLVTSNAGKKLPGVLILPAWKGIDEEAKNAALQLEKQGYVVFIADIYGEGNIPTDNDAAAKIAGTYKQDYKAYQQRISVALEELKKQGANPDKIAVIGYCFGGTGALETARAQMPVAGVISIHGGLAKSNDRLNVPIKTKVLVENPADDESVKPEDMTNLIAELKAGKTDFQIITYANSKHTFTSPESPDYNEVMAKRAWNHTLTFLKEILK